MILLCGPCSNNYEQNIYEALGTSLLEILITLGAGAILVIIIYQELLDTHHFIIATSPADAIIKIDGISSGKSPLNTNLKIGTYVIEAEKQGYEPAQHAVYVSGGKANDFLNIQLIPLSNQIKTILPQPAPAITLSQSEKSLRRDIEKLKAAVISNPDDAISLPLIREKLKIQEELSNSIREEIKELREQNKWYLGTIIGLFSIIIPLLIVQRSPRKAE
ncbi:PEGA domain-containing protein [Methylomagnum ishizawai]|uniref:PEGA domain-containing protein n=1 Tax=Methylomagnum ishizawai TaxID=1760988 RepID=A0A1Y6CWN8_9GAMM|nr:PEGA domain-containing protein [Methylomagnum ishizawai]SMF94757.1 PEGA domain-containing protein [Methylomagnum ishizawai]